ncbi:MAG: hypothetical protein HFJ35_04175 [Clostridia bacterium]|nr:hypothetical protein [Clostridia bacterium]
MKKILLKIIIGIIAVPTIIIGGLYLTRGIPAVSKYVVAPLAKLSQSIGVPVIVMPSDNYFKQEAREVYDQAVQNYNNRVLDLKDEPISEQMAKSHQTEGVTIYQNCFAGVKYGDLIIKPYEQFEKEWVEYSKEEYKNRKVPTQEEIDNYNANIQDANKEM